MENYIRGWFLKWAKMPAATWGIPTFFILRSVLLFYRSPINSLWSSPFEPLTRSGISNHMDVQVHQPPLCLLPACTVHSLHPLESNRFFLTIVNQFTTSMPYPNAPYALRSPSLLVKTSDRGRAAQLVEFNWGMLVLNICKETPGEDTVGDELGFGLGLQE